MMTTTDRKTYTIAFPVILDELLASRNTAKPLARTFLILNSESEQTSFRNSVPLEERTYSYEHPDETWVELPVMAKALRDDEVRSLARAWAADTLFAYPLPYTPHIEIEWDEESLRVQQVEEFVNDLNRLQEHHAVQILADDDYGLHVALENGRYVYPVHYDGQVLEV